MSARPLVTVQKEGRTVPLPKVFSSALRYDVVRFVHSGLAKNRRRPYAVTRRAGHKVSAESWGTGRAVARIPRVGGGGTHRSGQGAFGNMCRGGRMFAPTKIWRKWHALVPRKLRRLAIRAALAASAIPALVMARGHNLEDVPEIPLVVPNSVEALEKTKDAVKLLKDVGAYHDVLKCHDKWRMRVGKGKRRNRRNVTRKSSMLIISKRCEAQKAFRNLSGFDITYVTALNLLQLAPGGKVGRLLIWTEDAFNQIDEILKVTSIEGLPDSKRVINSEEVQSVIRRKKKGPRRLRKTRPRPLLNPAFLPERKIQRRLLAERIKVNADPKLRRAKEKKKKADKKLWLQKVTGKVDKKGKPIAKKPRLRRNKSKKQRNRRYTRAKKAASQAK